MFWKIARSRLGSGLRVCEDVVVISDNGSVEHGSPSTVETLPRLSHNAVGSSIDRDNMTTNITQPGIWCKVKVVRERRGIIKLSEASPK